MQTSTYKSVHIAARVHISNIFFYFSHACQLKECLFFANQTHCFDNYIFTVYREPALGQKWRCLCQVYVAGENWVQCIALLTSKHPIQYCWKATKNLTDSEAVKNFWGSTMFEFDFVTALLNSLRTSVPTNYITHGKKVIVLPILIK